MLISNISKFKTKSFKKMLSIFLTFSMITTLFVGLPQVTFAALASTDINGDWNAKNVIIKNTDESQLMVRAGDIDNFGFGWSSSGYNFDPFSGNDTIVHKFPWNVPRDEPAGLDRIMVVSGYKYGSKNPTDGYTSSTSRPNNDVKAIELSYQNELNGIVVENAVLQMFVDDIQPGNARGIQGGTVKYTATINGIRIPELETMINSLDQSGPRGRLITFRIPDQYLSLVKAGRISIKLDDLTTGGGDGYAVDFVKLLINFRAFSQTATIYGTVKDFKTKNPIIGAEVSVAGGLINTKTDSNGNYILNDVPAGQAIVTVSKDSYETMSKASNVIAGRVYPLNFQLVPALKPGIPTIYQTPMTFTSQDVKITVDYPDNPIKKEIFYNNSWHNYTGEVSITSNQEIKARSYKNYQNSDEATICVGNIIKPELSARRTIDKSEALIGKDILVQYQITPKNIEGINPSLFNKKEKDIVLVIDTSPSMKESLSNGTRLSVAKEAAKAFVQKFDGDDKVNISLVHFNSRAYLETANNNGNFMNMSNNNDILENKINNLSTASATNIGDGLRRAYYLLKNSPRIDSKKYIVFMTDGLANGYSYSNSNYVTDDRSSNFETYASDQYPQGGINYSNLIAKMIKPSLNKIDISSFIIGFFPDSISENAEEKLKEVALNADGIYKHAKTATDITDVYENIAGQINWDLQLENGTFTETLPEGIEVSNDELPQGFSINGKQITGTLEALNYKWNETSKVYAPLNNPTFTLKVKGTRSGMYELGKNSRVIYKNLDGTEVIGNFNSTNLVIKELKTPVLTPDIVESTKNDVKVTITNWGDAVTKEYRVKLGKGSWSEWMIYTEGQPVTVTQNGVIQARGKYDNENFSPIGELTITNIDKSKPTAPIINLNYESWTKENVIVTISGSNAPLGIQGYQYKIGNGQWTNYNQDIKPIITTVGETNIFARAVSKTGVLGIESSKVAQIDKTAPTGVITGNPTIYVKETTLTINASDLGGSGVKSIQKPDGTLVNGSTTTFKVTENKNYTFVVEDNAGNQQSISCSVNKIATNMPKLGIKVYDANGLRDSYDEQDPYKTPTRIDKILDPRVTLKGNAVAEIKVTDEKLKNVKYKFVTEPNMPSDGDLIDINDSIRQEVVYPDLLKDQVGYLTARNYDVSELPVKDNQNIWNDRSKVFGKPSSIIEYRSANCANSVNEYISKIDGKFKNYTIFMNYLDLGNKGPYPDYKEAAKFWGYITPPQTDDYYFGTKSDDGSQGYIIVDGNKVQIVDQFKIQGSIFKTDNNTIHLEKGKYYPIYLEYSNWGGDGEFRLLYKNTKFNSSNDETGGTTVPASWFRPSSNTNPGEVSTATFESTAVKGIAFPEETNIYYLAFKAENESGGIREGVYGPFLVDKILPTGSFTINPSTWTKSNVAITLNATDEHSGIKRIRKSDGDWTNAALATYTVSENGTYTFEVEDNAGNVAIKTVNITNIDKIAPSAPVITGPADGTKTNNNKPTITGKGEPGATVTVYDNGVSIGTAKVDSNGDWSLTPINPLSDGTHAITAEQKDAAGNVSLQSNIVNLIVDTLPPVITINPYITTPTNQDITVTATTNEGTLNVTTHKFTENGTFEFVATDAAGNVSKVTVTITNIDKTPPVITIGDYITTITDEDITVTATTNEGTLNVTTHTFTENGKFEFVATDVAGNVSRREIEITNIDKSRPTAPTITLSNDEWSNIDVDVTITGGTAPLGIQKYQYKIENGQWTDYDPKNKPKIDKEGQTNIYARAISTTGKEGAEAFEIAEIDKTNPEGNIAISTNDWTKNDITLTFTVNDILSGVKSVKKPDGTFVTGNTTYTVSQNGIYTFEVEDNAGNKISRQVKITNIDKVAPTGNIVKSTNDWTNQNLTLTFIASDTLPGSGVKRVRTKNGNWTNGNHITFIISQSGTYEFEVEDNAGNIGEKSIEVNNVDKSKIETGIFVSNQFKSNSSVNIAKGFSTNLAFRITDLKSKKVKLEVNNNQFIKISDVKVYASTDLKKEIAKVSVIENTFTIENLPPVKNYSYVFVFKTTGLKITSTPISDIIKINDFERNEKHSIKVVKLPPLQ